MKTIGGQTRTKARWRARATYVAGEIRGGIGGNTQKVGIGESTRSNTAKLPKLKITPFKGTPTDWVRFENMFVTQVDNRSISPEEKFGYLLEMVSANFRARFANLKPGEEGYKVAWKRLKAEYGQDKLVVNAHLEEIMNPPIVKGSN